MPSTYVGLQATLSVKDFGALGDGTTDDTAAIQGAINALPGPGAGGAIYFPPGNYRITAAITLRQGTTLRGSGYLSTRITVEGAINGLVYEPGSLTEGNICISDLRIIGTGTALTLVRMTRVTNIVLQRCNIRTANTGVLLVNCYHVTIQSCRLENFNVESVYCLNSGASTPTNVWTISGCDFQANNVSGQVFIRLTGSGWGSISDCTMEGTSTVTNAIALNGTGCIEIVNNFIEFVTGAVIYAETNASTNILVSRNHLHTTDAGTYVNFAPGNLGHIGIEVVNNSYRGVSASDTLFDPGANATPWKFGVANVDGTPAAFVGGYGSSKEVERLSDSLTIEWTSNGMIVQQRGSDGAIAKYRSTDIAHGMTSLTETDVFLQIGKSDGASGGASIVGLTEATVALEVLGIGTTDVTTKTTGSNAHIVMAARTRSGTSSTDVAANGNLLAIRNNNTTRFIFDSDGDSHQDVGTAWTNFDGFDDVAVLHALSVAVSREGDPLKQQFARYLEQHRTSLEAGRFVTFNEDGRHFINWSRTHMLMIGAIRQLGQRLEQAERRLGGGERTRVRGWRAILSSVVRWASRNT